MVFSSTPTHEQRVDWGRKGGLARVAKRTPEQLSSEGRRLAFASAAEKDEDGKSVNARKGALARIGALTPLQQYELSSKGGIAHAAQILDEEINRYTPGTEAYRDAWEKATGSPCPVPRHNDRMVV